MKHRFDHSKLFTSTPHCGGKRCYPTKQIAEDVKTEQEVINPDLTLSIYRCIQCGSWHLTRRALENS